MIPVYIYITHIILLNFYLIYLYINSYVYNNIDLPSKKYVNSSVILFELSRIKEDLVFKRFHP